MNYYVVSPNAWNDGNSREYLNYMFKRHVVFMGWGKGSKHGNTFAELQIGDRIIVAQGANYQKKSFFAGIVDAPPKYDDESGFEFTQYCELRSCVLLEEDELPFSTDCTGGKRKNPGSIHRLYLNKIADAKIIRRVEKLLRQHTLCYSLREIANWSVNKRVGIPALQRGLVWSPMQVELLWDSMLRGFPVGAFVITDASANTSQITEETNSDTAYFLLDGQQRYNAISLGYQKDTDQTNSVLWLDLLPNLPKETTRKFLFKVTTSSHPWGYENNDSCSLLGWRGYRDALKRFTKCEDNAKINEIKLQDLSLADGTWPIRAVCPIKMVEIMDSYRYFASHYNGEVAYEKFVERILEGLQKSTFYTDYVFGDKGNVVFEREKDIRDNLRKLWKRLESLESYRIPAVVLHNETIENEEKASFNGVTELENLFSRLNTLGTKISPYDLRYSAIKAYWGTIKETNDRIAGRIMPAANLAILAFRFAMTFKNIENGKNVLADVPSVSQIRDFGKARMQNDSDSSVSKFIENLYREENQEGLRQIIEATEKMLNVFVWNGESKKDGLPPVLRSAIISGSEDVYLLLVVLAYKKISITNILGLTLWVHWFSKKSKREVCNSILKKCLNNERGKELDGTEIIKSLEEEDLVLRRVDGKVFESLLPQDEDKLLGTWSMNQFRDDPGLYPWFEFFRRIAWNRELMIFSERTYFNSTFRYDPALTNFNSGHNKPWDVDHIVPKSWMCCQGKSFGRWKSFCNEWLWTIGNLAAIPFSVNRSKNNKKEWNEYCKNSESLGFDDQVQKLSAGNLCQDREEAHLFAKLCLDRIIRFYNGLLKTFDKDFVENNATDISH